MQRVLFFTFFLIGGHFVFGQYWFGPKIGISYIDHVYQESTYERDSFNVPVNLNFQAGFALSYTETGTYSVYGEIMYEKIGRTVKDKETNGEDEFSKMTNHFITVPLMLRVTLGQTPFHYYVNGGPRLSYWLGGGGRYQLLSFQEVGPIDEEGNQLPIDYKLTFNSDKSTPGNFDTGFVSDPNRLQFGLSLGGGVLFDLASGGKLQLDFRMNWIHSNMGNNSNKNTNLVHGAATDTDFYKENFEYFHNIASVSVGYFLSYDSNLKRRGATTSKVK